LDNLLAKFLIKQLNPLEKKNESVLQLFYNNQMNSGYKVDERIMKEIVANNIKTKKENEKLNLLIYYKNKKVSNLLMKNNFSSSNNMLKSTNVVY